MCCIRVLVILKIPQNDSSAFKCDLFKLIIKFKGNILLQDQSGKTKVCVSIPRVGTQKYVCPSPGWEHKRMCVHPQGGNTKGCMSIPRVGTQKDVCPSPGWEHKWMFVQPQGGGTTDICLPPGCEKMDTYWSPDWEHKRVVLITRVGGGRRKTMSIPRVGSSKTFICLHQGVGTHISIVTSFVYICCVVTKTTLWLGLLILWWTMVYHDNQ